MSAFRFCPELFDLRNQAIAALADAGLAWLADYGAVDIDHGLYGLEVCGIQRQEDAPKVLRILQARFPEWNHSDVHLREPWSREPGWKVILHRDPEGADGVAEGI